MTNLLGPFAPENHADLTTDDGKQSLLSEPAVKESNKCIKMQHSSLFTGTNIVSHSYLSITLTAAPLVGSPAL